MKNKQIIIALSILVLLIAGTFFIFSSQRENGDYSTLVSVKRTFYDTITGEPTKIIYDATGDGNLIAYQNDCDKLGGFFETCGHICEPNATACVEVCGVTCTLIDLE